MQPSLHRPHARRPPAHLSVCLRRDDPARLSGAAEPAVEGPSSPGVPPFRKDPDKSKDLRGEPPEVQAWFDEHNTCPEIRPDQRFQGDESPYFLRQHSSSNTSSAVSDSSPHHQSGRALQDRHALPGLPRSVSKGSSAGGFRSVIDDLTIENRKLKERLRKYEAAYSTHLDNEKLFELKIHGLAAKKKRELEETLRSFAASIDGSSDTNAKHSSRGTLHHRLVPSKNTSLSSTISRPVDSAYASMSNSGPTSTSKFSLTREGPNAHSRQTNKDQNIQSFLHNSPEGLLPNHSMTMSERQKKKLVVRRLEHLFTGQRGSAVVDHSQPLQQQEVSESAAMADRAARSSLPSGEGVREAHILPCEMETDNKRPRLRNESTQEIYGSGGPSESAPEFSSDSSPEQRPTRPIDLDPERAQIPSDNVEYLVHLGLSAPSLERGISGDVEADAEGWIYLNLLINMAQLHIINVTPDFVRSAVADVSAKFQLSRDGRKIRWRGGTDGTRFSSDSGTGSDKNDCQLDRDSLDEGHQKRRKFNAGRFAAVPVDIGHRKQSSKVVEQSPLYYKPLFRHQGSSSEEMTSDGESGSPLDYGTGHADETGTGLSRAPQLRSRWSHSMSGRRERRRNDGPIVFYSNAPFCTDLSGDRGTVSTPIHETGVDSDGYSNHTQNALGCLSQTSALSLSRTPSGSFLPSRPFKDYSKGCGSLQTDETRAKTPDMLVDGDSDLDVGLKWSCSSSGPTKAPMSFDASGLGGTQPADHFAVTVKTRRPKSDNHTQARLSKFSTSGPGSRRFLHTIPRSSFESSHQADRADSEDITSSLAFLHASSPPKGQHSPDLPVQAEVVSAQFFRLQPSTLPPPTGYYAALASSDSDSDASSDSSSFSGVSHLREQKPFLLRPHDRVVGPDPNGDKEQDSGELEDDEDDGEEADGDSDESIDMLALARAADPRTVAAREEDFERQAAQKVDEVSAGSLAATVDGESGFSSPTPESSGDTDMF
ncbi:Frequency clock [Hyphodiscus hymeniophilus]|uniref:Frequency clock n=1 Tax=Hyphodiscus hymeniophilus TaxID=353542 RepID=A0A9P6VFX2_9HELO|nr:Frequency clock [Hyphodiscus hymeniophilus]